METVKFFGHLYPAIIGAKVKNAPKFALKLGDIDASVKIEIDGGNVSVECLVSKFDTVEHEEMVLRYAYYTTRMLLSMMAFRTGIALTLVLDVITPPNGVLAHIVNKSSELPQLCTAFTVPTKEEELGAKSDGTFTEVLNLLIDEPMLCVALNTLVASVEFPDLAAINCARAIEHIRNLIDPNPQRGKAWVTLRDVLNIDKTYLEFITNHSIGPRHGDFTAAATAAAQACRDSAFSKQHIPCTW